MKEKEYKSMGKLKSVLNSEKSKDFTYFIFMLIRCWKTITPTLNNKINDIFSCASLRLTFYMNWPVFTHY